MRVGSIRSALVKWRDGEDGVALMETAMLFPILLVMLLGVYDVGHAITANHKMITASQVAADLITRSKSVSDYDVNQAIEAAGLAMAPYGSSEDIGIDIISVEFNEDDEPVEVWRETYNMEPNPDAKDKTLGLGVEGEGAVMVTVLYDFEPTFGSIVIDGYRMRETAFARGRRSSIVTHE